MSDADPYYEGRTRSPAARYGANSTPGVRWYDTETGQEQFALAVGIEDLVAAGADLTDPDDETRVVKRVSIDPNERRNGWTVRVSYLTADIHERDGRIAFIGTQTFTGAEGFDYREEAIDFARRECDAFADADVRDAADWFRERVAARGDGDE